ncbi:MAG: hypothetical protein HC884_05265 [Chloroflexaceae bacterium]|nr:hypothetical protein [Chloroflexaceae bacterium]
MWHMYQVVFRVRSPLHIGWNKVGNVQRTRPYATGRSLWGALTMRLTRDRAATQRRTAHATDYRKTGDWVHEQLAFTYFYPALWKEPTNGSLSYIVAWPWKEPSAGSFAHCFLSSYASTALTYPAQSATEGTLHEIEFLSPATIDTGETVYLVGYLFVHCDMNDHQSSINLALQRLQVGGERTYGWGRLEQQECILCSTMRLFSDDVEHVDLNNTRPTIRLKGEGRLLAHTRIDHLQAWGEVEPLVGREWQAMEAAHNRVGQYVVCNGVCFAPGARVVTPADTLTFKIGTHGVWECCI